MRPEPGGCAPLRPTPRRSSDFYFRGQINTTYSQRHLPSFAGIRLHGTAASLSCPFNPDLYLAGWSMLSLSFSSHSRTDGPPTSGRAMAGDWEVQPGPPALSLGMESRGQGGRALVLEALGEGLVLLLFYKSLKILRKINYIYFLTARCLSRCL